LIKERLIAQLAVFFGILALVLGCVGLYGVLAYSVVRRTREIGIRLAIGARPQRVVWMILKGTFVPVAAGLAIGIPLAIALCQYLRSLLFGLTPMDAESLGFVVLAIEPWRC